MGDLSVCKRYESEEITRILLKMRENCVRREGEAYDDPERDEKYRALNDAIDLINNPSRKVVAPVTGETSDGYHTFNELYHHRAVLFSVIVKAFPEKAWKAKKHDDGSMYDGMFIVGIETPDGQATYHYDINPYWEMCKCRELEYAPEWDGHTAAQAIERIGKLEPLWHARWIEKPFLLGTTNVCSKCGEYYGMPHGKFKFCPNCGAKMDGDKDA